MPSFIKLTRRSSVKLLRNNAGAAAIEYALFLSLIGVVLVLALQALQIVLR